MNTEELIIWSDKLQRLLKEPEETRGIEWAICVGEHLKSLVKDWTANKTQNCCACNSEQMNISSVKDIFGEKIQVLRCDNCGNYQYKR
jgi:hypothetical protein